MPTPKRHDLIKEIKRTNRHRLNLWKLADRSRNRFSNHTHQGYYDCMDYARLILAAMTDREYKKIKDRITQAEQETKGLF